MHYLGHTVDIEVNEKKKKKRKEKKDRLILHIQYGKVKIWVHFGKV